MIEVAGQLGWNEKQRSNLLVSNSQVSVILVMLPEIVLLSALTKSG